jgi:diguanylate cyclase (GGDEF)-like protein/PAS domain S-box-containing protein
MREIFPPPTSSSLLLPEHLLQNSDGQFIQLLFNSLSSAVLYLDQWGRICSANIKAKELFRQDDLLGKTVLEFLMGWDDPVHCHQEVLKVARTGTSIIGAVERAVIHNKEHWFQTDKVAVKDEENGINGVLMTLDDITTLKTQEVNLQQSEARYRAFVENSQDAIWRFDINPPIPIDWPKEAITEAIIKRATLGDCNDVFAKVYGVGNHEELKGLTLKETGSRTYAMDTQAFVAGDFRLNTQEIVWKTRSGDSVCLQTSANGTIEKNHLVEIWGVTRDTTERRRYVDRLEYQATHDILTGLPNRVKLQSVVNASISAKKEGESLALIIIDLDSFKEINDTLGHHVGDHIIKEIGPRIKRQVTNLHGTIARLGGDEFAILLPDIDSSRHARIIAEQILAAIRKDFFIDDMTIELRASMGISLYPDQAKDFSTLMRYADVAMYTAKQEMTSIEIYDPETDQHSPKRLSLMSDLGKAIRESQLTLYYQPKIDLDTQQVVGVEALSRWIHPTMGFISPAEFIPIAEMTDMINEMTEWVLDESLQQVRRWHEKGLNIKVAVNISARNLLNDTILQKIEWLLHRYELPPSCLELEITESTIMNNADRSLRILEEINNMGIDLSIDDFGTGYSSLAYLKRLPVKWLKIDYAFIINMLEDEQDQIIVNSTINMAHNLGLSVVAEGVENQEILSRLSSMQCEQAQGYHIARPMPANELEEWYQQYSDTVPSIH